MNLEETKKFLNDAVRNELRDHAFGDKEVWWEKDGKGIATGYSGSGMASVTITEENGTTVSFTNDDARLLMKSGIPGKVFRNDETGPEEFVEGLVMPGLTPESVFQELIRE